LSSARDGGSTWTAATSAEAATADGAIAGCATTAPTAACGTDACIASTTSSGSGTNADATPTGPIQLRHRCSRMADKMGAEEKGLVLRRAPLALPKATAGEATTGREGNTRGEATAGEASSFTSVGGSNEASPAADPGATANGEHHSTKLPDRLGQLANWLVPHKT